MLVRALMLHRNELVIADINESLESALKKMLDNNFLSIPVTNGKVFVGAISKEKIYEEYFEGDYSDKQNFLKNTKVKDVFWNIIPRVNPNDFIEKASRILETFGIPFVAVVNEREEFEGIVTHYGIFHEFGEIFGLNEGHRLAVTAYDVPGQLAKLTDIIVKCGGNLISFAVVNPKVKTDVVEFVARVKINNFQHLVERVKSAGFRVQ